MTIANKIGTMWASSPTVVAIYNGLFMYYKRFTSKEESLFL